MVVDGTAVRVVFEFWQILIGFILEKDTDGESLIAIVTLLLWFCEQVEGLLLDTLTNA